MIILEKNKKKGLATSSHYAVLLYGKRLMKMEAQESLCLSRQNRASTGDGSTPRRRRTRTSVIWKHCKSIRGEDGKDVTSCNHSGNSWVLQCSTSNTLQHLKSKHLDKFTDEDIALIDKPDNHNIDCHLANAILSRSLPLNILDNVEFAMFLEDVSVHTYKRP